MTQPGETGGYSASGHIKALIAHSHAKIFDYCILNNGEIPPVSLKRYKEQDSVPVVSDTQDIRRLGYRVIEDDIVSVDQDGVIRHDATKLARIILGIIDEI
jgi:2-phospho-L-lactate transferase/gluconeogenesis factor (CofD/UPF0052 family)